jgi:DNA-binding Xre family transcriptional regulator
MISFQPLLNTLKDRDMTISDLRGVVLDSKTIAKFKKGASMRLDTIERICLYLDVPVEKVIKIEPNEIK